MISCKPDAAAWIGGRLDDGLAQGAKILRKQDHSGMIDCYINRIESDEFHVKKKITKEEMAALLGPRVDLSTKAL